MECPRIDELPSPPARKTGWPWMTESLRLPAKTTDGADWPRISVVTPSYNQGKFLEMAIRSVLLQGYPDLEYFVMDGGSTDESKEILQKYSQWITHWESGRDRGQSHAINRGWMRASGSIVGWLNSDDLYARGAFASVARSPTDWCSRSLVYGDADIVDDRDRTIATKVVGPIKADFLLSIRHLPQPSVFLSREAISSLGPLREDLHFALDFDYFLRAVLTPDIQIQYIPEVLSQSREYLDTKSSTSYDNFADERRRSLIDVFSSPLGTGIAPRAQKRALAWVLVKRAGARARRGRYKDGLLDLLRAYKEDRSLAFTAELTKRTVGSLFSRLVGGAGKR